MTSKLLLGGIAVLALCGAAASPASAQDWNYDHPYTDYDGYAHTMALSQMSDAADRIDNIAVEVPSGDYAGEVRSVRTNFIGEPTRVGIRLRDNRWVWVDAIDMRYDPAHRVLRSSLSLGQLEDMSI
ncbi:MAG TPA: hypothetical protein VLW75_09115 [Rhizomicrobium sp.]|nr:hypothetical protein [Rhizomicrobium sp.]